VSSRIVVFSLALALGHLAVAPASAAQTRDIGKMSEKLIYSVGRTPERTFDTARDVEVITREEIVRANAQNLGQLLERRLGFAVLNGESGSMPILRGLAGKHVMFLIDGVKVNNATWRGASKEYLAIFDLSQIERIEIVRGVVSVLGMESLGGVVNIITTKAPTEQRPFMGVFRTRYSSADASFMPTILASGAIGRLRYAAGVSFTEAGDVRAGAAGEPQPQTGYKQKAGHLNGQWLVSDSKTLSFGYQIGRAEEVQTPGTLPGTGVLRVGAFDPSQLQLFRLSYLDLTDRRWEDSLQVSVYLNHQEEIRKVSLTTGIELLEEDADVLGGMNIELSSYLGNHHLVYGLDYTSEQATSSKSTYNLNTGVTVVGRGNLLDGASYRSSSIYLQDRFDVVGWLTVIGGLRLVRFESEGEETLPVGPFNIDQKRTNVTGALNTIFHVTPRLNLVGSAIRGYRAPNLDDASHSAIKPGVIEIPNPDVIPEKVLSLEAGVKYQNERFNGSLFYFRNHFRDLLVRTGTVFNGQSFNDINRNGVREPGESVFVQNQNVGDATITGLEADLTCQLPHNLVAFGNFSRLIGRDHVLGTPLTAMPSASGALGIRWSSSMTNRPWVEISGRFRQAQRRLSPTDLTNVYVGSAGGAAYRVLDIRGGMSIGGRVIVSAAVENVFDRNYRYMGSNRDQPGRQLVLGTEFRF
jgi:hemoglobin/transferrin/lactoferrin receptor protein